VVEPAHQDLSPQLGINVHIFLNLFQDLVIFVLLVVGDVSIDSEAPVVTSSISRICQLSLLEMLIGVELHACVRRGKCAYVYVSICICTV
jgi:hypothetical protein